MLFTCQGVFKVMMGHALFTCHGGSCCSCAFGFFMSWWFMLLMCFDVPSCHGGSCCFYMSWWFMLFMCHGVVYVMMVHAVHVSLCFFKVMVVHVAHV